MKLLLKALTAIAILTPLISHQKVSAEIVFRRDAPLMKVKNAEINLDYAGTNTLYELHITDLGNFIILFDEEYIELPYYETLYDDPGKILIELKREQGLNYGEPIIRPLDLISNRVEW
jgi:hypothetical protein